MINILTNQFPTNLVDNKGVLINEDSVIYNGKDYYRIYWNSRQPQVEAISCTNGYLHNITQDDLNHFELIGTYEDYKHLFECD